MIISILLFVAGIYVEVRFHPRLKLKDYALILVYVPKRGQDAVEKKLFNY